MASMVSGFYAQAAGLQAPARRPGPAPSTTRKTRARLNNPYIRSTCSARTANSSSCEVDAGPSADWPAARRHSCASRRPSDRNGCSCEVSCQHWNAEDCDQDEGSGHRSTTLRLSRRETVRSPLPESNAARPAASSATHRYRRDGNRGSRRDLRRALCRDPSAVPAIQDESPRP